MEKTMKEKTARLPFPLRMALFVAVLLLASVGALCQNTADNPPSGEKARAVLDLQPHHMTISVANLRAERDWYIEKLGFTVAPMGPPRGSSQTPPPPDANMQGAAQLKISGYRLDLIQYAGSQRATTPSPRYLAQGWVHIAFSVSNLDEAYSFLKAAGTDVTGRRDDKGALQGLLLHDPEGNEIELFSR